MVGKLASNERELFRKRLNNLINTNYKSFLLSTQIIHYNILQFQ